MNEETELTLEQMRIARDIMVAYFHSRAGFTGTPLENAFQIGDIYRIIFHAVRSSSQLT
jgi:hypothetical protein